MLIKVFDTVVNMEKITSMLSDDYGVKIRFNKNSNWVRILDKSMDEVWEEINKHLKETNNA